MQRGFVGGKCLLRFFAPAGQRSLTSDFPPTFGGNLSHPRPNSLLSEGDRIGILHLPRLLSGHPARLYPTHQPP